MNVAAARIVPLAWAAAADPFSNRAVLSQAFHWTCSWFWPILRNLRGALMSELANRITVNPKQCGGRPCIRGMRIRVVDVLDLLAAGLSTQDVIAELPDLTLEDIQACLHYASRRLNHPVLAA